MPSAADRSSTAARATVLGSVIVGLTAAAHAVGGEPVAANQQLLLVFAAAAPVAFAAASRRVGPVSVTAILMATQVVGHVLLGGGAMAPAMAAGHQTPMGDGHAAMSGHASMSVDIGMALPSPTMLAAHALAAVVLALTLASLDQRAGRAWQLLCARVGSVLRTWTPAITAVAVPTVLAVRPPASMVSQAAPIPSMRRGPPVEVAF